MSIYVYNATYLSDIFTTCRLTTLTRVGPRVDLSYNSTTFLHLSASPVIMNSLARTSSARLCLSLKNGFSPGAYVGQS